MKSLAKSVLLFIFLCFINNQMLAQQTAREILKQKTENELKQIVAQTPSLVGLMAVDLKTGESIAVNSDMQFAQASAIKIPILMEVFKQAHEKKFSLSDLRSLQPADIVGGSGILNAMTDPVSLSIRNLCVLMIGLSDNTATNTLINLVGMQNINNTMRSLGFHKTKVQRKMIDQAASLRNEENISSPADAVAILKLLYDGKFIDQANSEEIVSILRKNPRENSKIAKALPAQIKLGFKPGGMGGVSTEWAIVYLPNRPYALAVMENYKTANSTRPDVFEAISKSLFHYFSILKANQYGVILEN